MLVSSATLTSCNSLDEDSPADNMGQLSISVGLNRPQSRALITGEYLPEGSQIGVMLDDGVNTKDYDSYSNLCYTATGTGDGQKWETNIDVLLSETKGTLYASFPYADNMDLSAIPIEIASQTDYLYATPVPNISENNSSATVTLNHVLANINLTLLKGTYIGTGNVTNIIVQSDGIASKGTFNAAQPIPDYSNIENAGSSLDYIVTTTLGATATDIMVIPTGTSAIITFIVIVDGTAYSTTSTPLELEKGKSYEYVLTLNSTFLDISKVIVNPWNSVPKEGLTFNKVLSGPDIDVTGTANGVYAITAVGELVDQTRASASCIGVALITDNQKIMIEKNGNNNTKSIQEAYAADGATDTRYTEFYWGMYNADVKGLNNIVDNTAAQEDFAGAANTAAIQSASDTDSNRYFANMGTWCTKFNETPSENQGYIDWYIPAAGQLYEISINKGSINKMLTAIGGTTLFNEGYYWSSSECDAEKGWYVNFGGSVFIAAKKNTNICGVRLVRDIK